ncbi:MAG: peptidoglycan-binding domain-containing protein [Candidatus Omnitrophota bacterium]|nr:peptidoglycan-binding domain-containing protein [Candidatus Omnitrophota bacterium]
MCTRIILFVFFAFTLAGCATGSKKQAAQSQPKVTEKSQKVYQQESYSEGYGANDTWSAGSYEKSAKKTYTGSRVELSLKQIQRALKSAGFYQGPIDGKIGPKTKEAIRKFQKANGLKADGIVGKRTSAELNEYLPR